MHVPAAPAAKVLMQLRDLPMGNVHRASLLFRRPLHLSFRNTRDFFGRNECMSDRRCEPTPPTKCECPSTHVPDGDWCQPIFDCPAPSVWGPSYARPRDRWCQLPETGNFGPVEVARRAEERAAAVWLRSNKDALAYSAWFAGRIAGRNTDPLGWRLRACWWRAICAGRVGGSCPCGRSQFRQSTSRWSGPGGKSLNTYTLGSLRPTFVGCCASAGTIDLSGCLGIC